MTQVSPTKGNLTAAKRSRELAVSGYEMMDKKRSILIRELMSLTDEAQKLQREINRAFSEAYASMRMAEISMEGCAENGTDAIPADDSVTLRFRSVMGVEVPRVDWSREETSGLPYGLAYTSEELDDAYFRFSTLKGLILTMAQVENSIYRLAYAVKQVQKRANALKNIVIPGLDEQIAYITDALAEKEREEFTRLKVVKERK